MPQDAIATIAITIANLIQDEYTADESSDYGDRDELHQIRHGLGPKTDGGKSPAVITFASIHGPPVAEKAFVVGAGIEIKMLN